MYGNLILVARVEDNDQYGNPLVEKTIFWNVAIKQSKNFFDQRTLWSTRFRRPFWLLFMAYSIVSGEWVKLLKSVYSPFTPHDLTVTASSFNALTNISNSATVVNTLGVILHPCTLAPSIATV